MIRECEGGGHERKFRVTGTTVLSGEVTLFELSRVRIDVTSLALVGATARVQGRKALLHIRGDRSGVKQGAFSVALFAFGLVVWRVQREAGERVKRRIHARHRTFKGQIVGLVTLDATRLGRDDQRRAHESDEIHRVRRHVTGGTHPRVARSLAAAAHDAAGLDREGTVLDVTLAAAGLRMTAGEHERLRMFEGRDGLEWLRLAVARRAFGQAALVRILVTGRTRLRRADKALRPLRQHQIVRVRVTARAREVCVGARERVRHPGVIEAVAIGNAGHGKDGG